MDIKPEKSEKPHYFRKTVAIIRTFLNNAIKIFTTLPWKKIIPITAIIIYLIVFVVVSIFVVTYSYRAWLYPIRLSQYFDECSYISMGKYFRTLSPITLFTDFIQHDKNIPEMYHEFESRMIYWPIIMAAPLKLSEDRIFLHTFRAILLAIGSLIFFLLGRKLAGISGGVVAAAFWIGTPLLNYWGHFLMTENPSFVFIAMAYLLLLYSDKSRWASVFGGIFLGLAAFTRFTTIVLILPAPFLITAAWLHPLRRKNFQILGESGKTLGGFCVATVPYLVFTALLFKNPLKPFQSARFAVDQFPVDDPDYYVRNLWIEGGPLMRTGALLAIAAPIIIGLALALLHLIKHSKKKRSTGTSETEIDSISNETAQLTTDNSKTEKRRFWSHFRQFFIVLSGKLKTFVTTPVVSGSVAFSRGFIYYVLILVSLIVTASIYLYGVSDIPHKLPRYLMGALIPCILISAIGFGAFEKLVIALARFFYNFFVTKPGQKKSATDNSAKKQPLIAITIISFCTVLAVIPLFTLTRYIWQTTMERPFTQRYDIPKDVIKSIPDRISVLRAQPELLSWKESIAERLQKVKDDPKSGIDKTKYYGRFPFKLIKYLNNNAKYDEVLYTDSQTMPPFTPAYTEIPCMFINRPWGHSIKNLQKKGELPYKGYVLLNSDESSDYKMIKGKRYRRSLSRDAVIGHTQFKKVKKFGRFELYYYKGGKPFPWQYGTKERISRIYPDDWKPEKNTGKKELDSEKKSVTDRLFYSFFQLFKQQFSTQSDQVE